MSTHTPSHPTPDTYTHTPTQQMVTIKSAIVFHVFKEYQQCYNECDILQSLHKFFYFLSHSLFEFFMPCHAMFEVTIRCKNINPIICPIGKFDVKPILCHMHLTFWVRYGGIACTVVAFHTLGCHIVSTWVLAIVASITGHTICFLIHTCKTNIIR